MRVELLGAFRVVVDGDEFADTVWPSRRSAQLVQLLALAERRCLQRERVDALDRAGRVVRIDLGPLGRGEVAAHETADERRRPSSGTRHGCASGGTDGSTCRGYFRLASRRLAAGIAIAKGQDHEFFGYRQSI